MTAQFCAIYLAIQKNSLFLVLLIILSLFLSTGFLLLPV